MEQDLLFAGLSVSQLQRRLSLLVLEGVVRLGLQQGLHGFVLSDARGPVQGRFAIVVLEVPVDAERGQNLDQRDGLIGARLVGNCLPVIVPGIDVGLQCTQEPG